MRLATPAAAALHLVNSFELKFTPSFVYSLRSLQNKDEDLLLEVRAKYYRFKKGDGWKDRGVGVLKCYKVSTGEN